MPFAMRPVRVGRGSRTLLNSHRPAEAHKEVSFPFQANKNPFLFLHKCKSSCLNKVTQISIQAGKDVVPDHILSSIKFSK